MSARKPTALKSPPELAEARIGEWSLLCRQGAGASGTVYRAARSDGTLAALKVACSSGGWVAREAMILASVQRRWGPALIDRGVVHGTLLDPAGASVPAGAAWMAMSWVDGVPLADAIPMLGPLERSATAAWVAHGVARGLAELHGADVRHGDVKPANILLGRAAPRFDRAADRAACLVDLGLATTLQTEEVVGATPRYLAPEVRAGEPSTPAADLYALGLVLAETIVPELAAAPALDPSRVAAALERQKEGRHAVDHETELLLWIEALSAEAPGARPSAAWLGSRAARWLQLAVDPAEAIAERHARVRRTYVRAHAARLSVPADRIDPAIEGVARTWLEEALVSRAENESQGGMLSALDALGLGRWLVSLVGPAAAAWPTPVATEGRIAERLLALAATTPPDAWTLDDVVGRARPPPPTAPEEPDEVSRWLALTRALAQPRPDETALERAETEVMAGRAPASLALDLASASMRGGDVGRAYAALGGLGDVPRHRHVRLAGEALLLRAEVARRRGDREEAVTAARAAIASEDAHVCDDARALLGRLAWDEGDLDRAEAQIADAGGAAVVEVRALIAYARGDHERGLAELAQVPPEATGLALARLDGTRGMLEHARGRPKASLRAFRSAVDLATRAGAAVEEATYLTGLAAAAVDAGAVAAALAASTRGALLWERLGRPALAARAHLSRAAAFALVGASHEAELAAAEARRHALASNDRRAAAYARWAIVETRPPGDERAAAEVVLAAEELANGSEEDRVRAAARVLVWNPAAASVHHPPPVTRALSATARWEWWGARALGAAPSSLVLTELLALLDVPAPVGSRGPALAAAGRLARQLGDGDATRRIETVRRTEAIVLREGTPPELRAALSAVAWLDGADAEDARAALGASQVGELEAIVRALSSRDRLKPLLTQVVDTMVLWAGVERGLLLLTAPDGQLVARAARNLARQDLGEEQLALSMSLARRAMAERQAICATDALTQMGELHASVHALGLRSVLAVPLIARGDVLGVLYLDDRVRRGAFGPSELAWVRLVASQAALAIADARDQALLRRAVRKAERANARLSTELGAREAELESARAELASAGGETRFRYDEISGRSEPMRTMLRLVDRVTASDVPVLLAGESGTGKELVARAIHRNGPRGARPFVSENCGSVPESLLESTLFGHVRGAFTGASATRAGLFDVADGGTLLLDEIGEMPLAMQTKLLRVLQNGEVRPVGGERSRTVDVRIIGATHRDLEAMVAAGAFREDLFYRLNVVSIRIPALRERPEDVPLLVGRFVDHYAAGRRVKVTRAAMDRLVAFPWPGNVRQLENEVRRALVLADERIDVGELSEEVARGGPTAARDAGLGLKARVDALEAQLVRDALQKTNGNQTRAAEVLGISRFGLQKMMRRLGVKP